MGKKSRRKREPARRDAARERGLNSQAETDRIQQMTTDLLQHFSRTLSVEHLLPHFNAILTKGVSVRSATNYFLQIAYRMIFESYDQGTRSSLIRALHILSEQHTCKISTASFEEAGEEFLAKLAHSIESYQPLGMFLADLIFVGIFSIPWMCNACASISKSNPSDSLDLVIERTIISMYIVDGGMVYDGSAQAIVEDQENEDAIKATVDGSTWDNMVQLGFIGTGGNIMGSIIKPDPAVSSEEQQKMRERSIRMHVSLLEHAFHCDDPKKCPETTCLRMKKWLDHFALCGGAKRGCELCVWVSAPAKIYAQQCKTRLIELREGKRFGLCSFCGEERDLYLCGGTCYGAQAYCRRTCQKRHWRKDHYNKCMRIGDENSSIAFDAGGCREHMGRGVEELQKIFWRT